MDNKVSGLPERTALLTGDLSFLVVHNCLKTKWVSKVEVGFIKN